MRLTSRWLCSFMLALGTLACGNEPQEPCSTANAAAGRCTPTAAGPAALPPGGVLPDWALRLCQDWRRTDGTCDQMQILEDYQECLSTQGVPEQDRLIAQGVGSRAVQRARERATHLCLELRRWVMSEEAQERWAGRPRRPAPPK